MQKILVTTDLSNKSKAGLQFAIQLASQTKIELTFFHVFHVLAPTSWAFNKIEEYEKVEAKLILEKFEKFVDKIYKGMNLPKINMKCVIKSSVSPQSCIMDYAAENKFNFICISTRGAGRFNRLFGTNTSNLITKSVVPIIAIPFNYKSNKITSILYASDLVNLEKEIKIVTAFAKPLKSSIELLHLTSAIETIIDSKIMQIAINKIAKHHIKLNIKNIDLVEPMVNNIETAIKKIKPSMMIMFTEPNRGLFEKIFLPSKTVQYSFNTKVPLLVFKKSSKSEHSYSQR